MAFTCCGCGCRGYTAVVQDRDTDGSIPPVEWQVGKTQKGLLRWRGGKNRRTDAWPEAQAPTDDAISQSIANRIDGELEQLRKAVFLSRSSDDTKKRRPAVAVDFAEHLQKLKMLMLVAKVDLRVESVNKKTGSGVYHLVDRQLDSFVGKETSAAVLQVERPSEEGAVWKVSFIPGGRVRMDSYALMVQRLISWRFFTPNDRFEGDGIPKKWMPTGSEVQEVALQSSMKTLSFRFLKGTK